MKKFNTLTPKRQKRALLLCCLLFISLLLLSIRYQRFTLNAGFIQQPRIKNR